MKEESCEFLIIGNGLQETCLCALLNIWNHRAICIEYPGHSCISSDTSEYLFEDVIIQQDHPISTRIKI